MNLVIGATGSLGGLISHRLLNAGAPTRALVRERSDYSSLHRGGAEVALGDLKNPRSLDRACMGVERIIATATAAARGGEDTIEAVDHQGYSDLIATAIAAGVERFIFISAHGFGPDSPVALARAKAATEESLTASGLDYTVLRPALFMESWISMLLGAQLQRGPNVQIMGDPEQPLSFVSIANVADLAIATLDHPEVERTAVPLSAQAVSYRQIVEWIDEFTGRSIAIEAVPPGTEIPGLPPIVLELWSWLATAELDPIETVGVAMKFGLALESPKSFVARTFGQASPV